MSQQIIPVKVKTYKMCQKQVRGRSCGKRIETFLNCRGEVKEICPEHGEDILPEKVKHGAQP